MRTLEEYLQEAITSNDRYLQSLLEELQQWRTLEQELKQIIESTNLGLQQAQASKNNTLFHHLHGRREYAQHLLKKISGAKF